jgi:hypothetical protein
VGSTAAGGVGDVGAAAGGDGDACSAAAGGVGDVWSAAGGVGDVGGAAGGVGSAETTGVDDTTDVAADGPETTGPVVSADAGTSGTDVVVAVPSALAAGLSARAPAAPASRITMTRIGSHFMILRKGICAG